MDLSIIIVSWNVKERLKECLSSIVDYNSPAAPSYLKREMEGVTNSPLNVRGDRGVTYEIFVIDNASSDGSAEMVAREFPEVTLIANNYNAGFAKANNQAMALATGEFILLLNPDMRVFPDTLPAMVAFMRERPEVGIAGCHLVRPISPPLQGGGRGGLTFPILYKEGTTGEVSLFPDLPQPLLIKEGSMETVPHARRFPTFSDQAAIVLKVPHLFSAKQGAGFPRAVARYEMRDFDYSREQEVDSIRGSFFMIRRKVIKQIGMLDERFFIWFEEVDFCKRARDAGWKVMYTPAAQCVDYVGQSFKQVKHYPKQKMFTRSMLTYFKKHRPWYEWLGIFILRPFGLAAAWAADQLTSFTRRGSK